MQVHPKEEAKINQQFEELALQNSQNPSLNKVQINGTSQLPKQSKIKLQTKLVLQKQQENALTDISQRLQTLNNYTYDQNQVNYNQFLPQRGRSRNNSQQIRPQDVRVVATSFIQYGINFKRFSTQYPHIDAKFYRNTVQSINNTAIIQMQKFLRYECNIQIQKLNRDQKRSIRTQFTKAREWLGKKDMTQLQTLYKFIQRKYQLVNVHITMQEALKFYKTILQIVKSPFVDVMQDDIKPQKINPQINNQLLQEEKQSQEKTLIYLYIQHQNISKVSDILCEKFGYKLKFSKFAVKQKIKHLVRCSIKKLIGSVQAYDKNIKLFFSQAEECINLLMKNQQSSTQMRCFLLKFCLQKTITLIQLRQYIKNINKFFIKQFVSHGQYECKQFQQDVKIPKLQIKDNQKQKFEDRPDFTAKKTGKKQLDKTIEHVLQTKQAKKQIYLPQNCQIQGTQTIDEQNNKQIKLGQQEQGERQEGEMILLNRNKKQESNKDIEKQSEQKLKKPQNIPKDIIKFEQCVFEQDLEIKNQYSIKGYKKYDDDQDNEYIQDQGQDEYSWQQYAQ